MACAVEWESVKTFHGGKVELHPGDCMEVLAGLPDNSIDAVVTDPPYHLTSIVKRFGRHHKLTTTSPVIVPAVALTVWRGFPAASWASNGMVAT